MIAAVVELHLLPRDYCLRLAITTVLLQAQKSAAFAARSADLREYDFY